MKKNTFKLIFALSIYLSCAGCITKSVINKATTRPTNDDKYEYVESYRYGNRYTFHLYGELADGRKGDFTVNAVDISGIDYKTEPIIISRSEILEGYVTPPPNYQKVPLYKFSELQKNHKSIEGCGFVEMYSFQSGARPLNYYCKNQLTNKPQYKEFIIDYDYGAAPIYKLMLIPITIPFDVITFPFQLMLWNGLKNVN